VLTRAFTAALQSSHVQNRQNQPHLASPPERKCRKEIFQSSSTPHHHCDERRCGAGACSVMQSQTKMHPGNYRDLLAP
jgi:hypothetical protein